METKETIKKAYYILKHPKIAVKEFVNDVYSDYLSISGKVNYKHHLIFIAGQPKSGTSWLEKILDEVPGFVQLNGSIIRRFKKGDISHGHGISEEMLSLAPKKRYSYLKLHTHYDPTYIKILNKYNIKTVVLIRDIRDMMISRYYHIMSDTDHWFYDDIKDLSFDEGFTNSLYGVSPKGDESLQYYKNWQKGWIEYAMSYPDKALLVKYENMKKDIHNTLDIILKFYEIYFNKSDIDRIINAQIKKQLTTGCLSKNLKLPGRLKTTFRRGKIGEWNECFNENHKKIFKNEVGDVLILAGYECNKDW